jgi:polyhydroxyalkanoate synthesis regulator phasin
MQASHAIRALLKDSNVEQQKALNAIADLLDGLQERIARLEEEVQALKAKPDVPGAGLG